MGMDLISSAILAIALTHSLWVILSIVLSPVILKTHKTNPPYNSRGAVYADRIDKTVISNNNFTCSSGSSILSERVTNSKIRGNIFNLWGVATVAPVACIVLDSGANTLSKSYGNEIDGNTFYNTLKVGGYLLESGTFDTNNFWGNGNRIRLDSQATLTALFNTPNFKLSQSVSFRRNLIAGENIGLVCRRLRKNYKKLCHLSNDTTF